MEESLAASQAATRLVQGISREIVNPIVVVLFAFALVVFLWGVRRYIAHADDPEERAQGAQHILWGIIGMGLMVMSFAIARIVANTFGVAQDAQTKEDIENVLGPGR